MILVAAESVGISSPFVEVRYVGSLLYYGVFWWRQEVSVASSKVTWYGLSCAHIPLLRLRDALSVRVDQSAAGDRH